MRPLTCTTQLEKKKKKTWTCCSGSRWKPTIWSRRAALLSVVLLPWAPSGASCTATSVHNILSFSAGDLSRAHDHLVHRVNCVLFLSQSHPGDYLVTIEEKNSSTYLRAYTNWRYQVWHWWNNHAERQPSFFYYFFSILKIVLKCDESTCYLCVQAEEKARVGVRLLGHLLRGASQRGGVQMEIIEIPLSERPVAVACCPVTGDLLVGCDKTLVLFSLRRQNQQNTVSTKLIRLAVFQRFSHLTLFCHPLCLRLKRFLGDFQTQPNVQHPSSSQPSASQSPGNKRSDGFACVKLLRIRRNVIWLAYFKAWRFWKPLSGNLLRSR